MRPIRRFARLPWAKRVALIEAAVSLACARLVIVLVPFRHVAALLGTPQLESSARPSTGEETGRINQVRWSITVAARHVPWEAVCLPQAMAGKWMLKRRGVISTLYLGVKRSEARMQAHAWLRAGETIVTGGQDSPQHFTVVSCFS